MSLLLGTYGESQQSLHLILIPNSALLPSLLYSFPQATGWPHCQEVETEEG
jgi:hypothetical protein